MLSENIKHFAEVVRQGTSGRMLDLVMGDGGVSVEGDENNQETLLKQLVMCQFLMMFNILREGIRKRFRILISNLYFIRRKFCL